MNSKIFSKSKAGFTVLELLIVIVIVGILAGTLIFVLIQGAAQSRDARRVQELYQIGHALQQYYTVYGEYPENTDSGDIGCWGNWDGGSILNGEDDPFIQPLIDEGFIAAPLIERNPTGSTNWEKCSYRYMKVDNPCCGCSGTYAVLYGVCETNRCPTNERPACCTCWDEGAGINDPRDIIIFLKEE